MKKIVTLMLIALLVFGCGVGGFAGLGITNTMNFTGDTVKLSLDQAIERMTTTGPSFEAVMLAKKGNEAAAKGQFEYLKAVQEAEDQISALEQMGGAAAAAAQSASFSMPSSTGLTGLQASLGKEFYTAYAPVAYEAGINGIKSNTLQVYYGMLLTQQSYDIAKNTTAIKKALLDNTNKKFKLGVASKMDVLLAKNALLAAQEAESEALTSVNTMKMQLNMAFGYDLTQKIEFTDKLVRVPAPEIDLDACIASALAERADIMKAKYDMDNAQLDFNSVKAYPSGSATYMGKEAALNGAKLAYDTALLNVELELRSAYMKLHDLDLAITTSQSSFENAKEAARLFQLQYDAGLCTLAQLQEAQNNCQMAELGLYNAIMQYDIAVYNFGFASHAGTK